MPRNDRSLLLRHLENYRPINSDDKKQAEKVLKFVSDHPHCFERSLLKGHITGSAWVVDETGEKVLLTHHKKINKWLQLGGHADGNPDVFAVALREAEEESGLKNFKTVLPVIFDLDVHLIPERKNEPAHFHYDIRFVFKADSTAPLKMTHESQDLAWVFLGDLERYSTEASLLRMREKWRSIQAALD